MSFLQSLTSRQGKNLITGPHKTRVRQDGTPSWDEHWVDFADEVETQKAIDRVERNCKGVYFALGSFKQNERSRYARRAVNCLALRSFWLDIDCGEEKWQKHNGVGVYRTRQDGQLALVSLLQSTGIPNPTYIVSSGAGYHVYWELDRDVPIHQWRQTALLFKAICTRWNFQADPARTADASSVLRVPGTLHKSGAVVEIISQGDVVSYDYFSAVLEQLRPFVQEPAFQQYVDNIFGLGEVPTFAQGMESSLSEQELSTPKLFGNIIKRSELENNGCKQILYMYENQDKVPEPMWGAALSIAKFCLDGEEWAIKISENHPEFDPAITIRKMNQWTAPRTCRWFMDNHPAGCKGCPHLATMAERPTQSPIMLAVEDNRVPVVVKAVIAGGSSSEKIEEDFVIPSLPFPYYRHGEFGGVWFDVQGEGDAPPKPTRLYDFDLYIYDRIGTGVDNKPRFWARQHTPHDGVVEMELSSDDIFGPVATLPQRLAAHNILLPVDTSVNDMYKYLRTMAANLQRTRAITKPPKQLGWTDNGSFVLGRWEYTKAGCKMSPIPDTNIARNFASACERRRDCHTLVGDWNKALDRLYGAEDAQLYRLILASGFGAPIRAKFGSEVGGVLNIYSEDSGLGKTTLTKVIAGIFGNSPDPFVLQAQHGTTTTAFFEIISYVNSLPLTLDETGQMDTDSLLAFVHTCTSGRAKARGSAQVNDIRQTLPGWKSHVFSSSNVSLWNRITENQAENEAYLMRIVEIPVKALKQSQDKNYGDAAVRAVQGCYGVAGPLFLEYLLQNINEIGDLYQEVAKEISEKADLHARHRFWGDIITAAVVGAKVAHDAGVFPFNPNEIKQTALQVLADLKTRADTKVVSEKDLFGEMLNAFIDATIIVKNSKDSTAALKTPLHKAYVRLELDDKRLYIDNIGLREFARNRQFGIERLEMALEDMGGRRGVLKRMWDNTDFKSGNPQVRTWCVDLSKPEALKYINPQDYYADDTGNASSSNG